ncbi:Fatty acyl-CoA reductase 1 [Blattella germanica]|nr:Fatty acyl-CoA reductase 1 [Blattella germanica]
MGSDEECSQITAFFSGCNVLVTGATGFMGKVLVEKLLRSCTDIRAIYLLMRPKNGSNLEDRLREFKANVIFDRLREEGPVGMLDKLTAVNGDVTQIGLGLSKPDTCKLCSEVNVVFHCAATVRFDDTDRQTILLNTRGTQELTSLALQMQHLKVLVLVSTAYSNADRSFIDEVVYPAHEDYNYVIKCAEKLEDLELSRLTTEMMKGLPNTYVFSKSLGENIVYDQKGKLPAAIFRPSLVCPAYEEPMPGWVDSKNGPMGVLIGASTGLLRTMRGDGNKKTDLIPVDFAINAMIAVAWHIATTQRLDIPVYNCTTSSQVDVTWNGFLDLGIQEYDKWPLLQVFWYPGGAIHCSKLMHLICFFIKQLIPAMLLDLVPVSYTHVFQVTDRNIQQIKYNRIFCE